MSMELGKCWKMGPAGYSGRIYLVRGNEWELTHGDFNDKGDGETYMNCICKGIQMVRVKTYKVKT